MKYACYDQNTGKVIGFYDDTIHTSIPEPNVQLTDDQFNRTFGGDFSYINGQFVQNVPPPPNYAQLRAAEYPSFADQFDLLYHGGYDAWKAAIQAVKDKYPKPS